MIKFSHATKYFNTKNGKKYILNDVNLSIQKGKNIAVLGKNGAGKTTFLKLLGGVEYLNSGTIKCDKKFSWPMGFSGGFQGSMTGFQNVKFVSRIYGKSEDEIKDIVEFVKAFSDIGDYFYMPFKTYSSGMKGRLSFGLSLAFDFDYLLVDEALSVGDPSFNKKAKDAIFEKVKTSNTILVSHSVNVVREICNVGIFLKDGELKYFEDIEEAINCYLNQ